MRIAVLGNVEREGADDAVDVVVPQVVEALRENGHDVSVLAVCADPRRLIDGIERLRPELVFNLLEEFGGLAAGNIAVAGLLDLLKVPYTGVGPGEAYIGQDKALAKKILAFEGIPYPRFAVFPKDAGFETGGGNLRLPLFVKPVDMDASIGIGGDAIVHDTGALMKRVVHIHETLGGAALAEEYIEGREFQVGVLGNAEPLALPPVELDFSGMPADMPHVMDHKAKFEVGTPEYEGTKIVVPELPDELRAKLQKVSVDAYRALRVRDYGRVDLRLAETGEIYVIEANASCYLEKSGEFCRAAEAAGMTYPALVQRIVDLAMERYGR